MVKIFTKEQQDAIHSWVAEVTDMPAVYTGQLGTVQDYPYCTIDTLEIEPMQRPDVRLLDSTTGSNVLLFGDRFKLDVTIYGFGYIDNIGVLLGRSLELPEYYERLKKVGLYYKYVASQMSSSNDYTSKTVQVYTVVFAFTRGEELGYTSSRIETAIINNNEIGE